jgi:DNA-binding MarR family transcriptional regulator
MGGKLAKEIRQTKPFTSREEEAMLNLSRTHETLNQRFVEFLKPYGLTSTQYNMLRILRGAGPDGATCSQATERMLSPDPDVTRLLDRMEARHLIRRERSTEDRRVVVAWISAAGLELVNKIDQPLAAFHKRNMSHVGQRRLEELIDILESLRDEKE